MSIFEAVKNCCFGEHFEKLSEFFSKVSADVARNSFACYVGLPLDAKKPRPSRFVLDYGFEIKKLFCLMFLCSVS